MKKYLWVSVCVHFTIVLFLIFYKSGPHKPEEIIEPIQMVDASATKPLTQAPLVQAPVEKTTEIDSISEKEKAKLEEEEQLVSKKKNQKNTPKKIEKESSPPLPKVKSKLKNKLDSILKDKEEKKPASEEPQIPEMFKKKVLTEPSEQNVGLTNTPGL